MRLSMIAVVAGLGLAGCQPTTTPPPTPAPTPLTDAEQNAAREALMAHEGEWDCSAPAPFDRTVRRLLVEDLSLIHI